MTTTATDPSRPSLTVDRFLDAIGGGGGIPAHLLAADIILDATVPDWRFNVRGSDAVARQYGMWFAVPAAFEELERLPVAGLRGPNAVAGLRGPNAVAGLRGPNAVAGLRGPNAVAGGEVVTYLLTWEENGVPQAAHHCHVLRFDENGCIAQDRFFCGGRWDAARLAEMAAAEHAG